MSRRSSNAIDPSIDLEAVRRERGIAMAALLAGITILFIGMGAAASSWTYVVQDNEEQELLFRGLQIVKALKRLQLQNERPPTLKYLFEKKQLRQEYLDPITAHDPTVKGQWRYIHDGQPLDLMECGLPSGPPGTPGNIMPGNQGQPGIPGQPGMHGDRSGGPRSDTAPPEAVSLAGLFWTWALPEAHASDEPPVRLAQGLGGGSGTTLGGASGGAIGETSGGPIIGVRSRSKKQSIRVFWGKNKYDEWCFTEQTVPDYVVSIEQMTYPKGLPPPTFEKGGEPSHPWTPPDR
jgi:type II secretory pathway pseudopilin PulG